MCKSFVTQWPRKSSLKSDDSKTSCPLPSPQFPASLSPLVPDHPNSVFLIMELPVQRVADGHTGHYRDIQSIRQPDTNGGLRSEAAGPVNRGGHNQNPHVELPTQLLIPQLQSILETHNRTFDPVAGLPNTIHPLSLTTTTAHPAPDPFTHAIPMCNPGGRADAIIGIQTLQISKATVWKSLRVEISLRSIPEYGLNRTRLYRTLTDVSLFWVNGTGGNPYRFRPSFPFDTHLPFP